MLKALLKKQFLELYSFYFQDKKTGKIRSKGKTMGYFALFGLLMLFLCGVFFGMASIFQPLLESPMPWIYFSLMGIMAIVLGVFGSVFNTYAGLYHAKDNELLLSMPIPPSRILLVRIVGVAAMAMMYSALILLPTILVRFLFGNLNALVVLNYILMLPLLTLFAAVLTCFLGWIVALISSKLKNKSIFVVALTLIFLFGYYYFCSHAYELLGQLLQNAQAVGEGIKTWLYPFYLMGLGAEGNPAAMAAFSAGVLALFALTYWILSKSFIRIVTKKESGAKAVYKEESVKASSAGSALFRKEMRRFVSSPTYMLNCGLGVLFLPLAAAVLVWKKELVNLVISEAFPGHLGFITVVFTAISLSIVSMNLITAPSISLEGKSLWVLQSLPVDPWQVLRAKVDFQVKLTIVPGLLVAAAIAYVLRPGIVSSVLLLAIVGLATVLCAELGLILNLKMPNLTWTNEMIPVKQGAPVMIMLFGGWAAAFAVGGGYFFLEKVLSAQVYLGLLAAILAGLCFLSQSWLKTRGSAIFESL